MIENTCLVTSLHLVQARMVKTCPKKVNKSKVFFLYIKQNVKKFYTYIKKASFQPINYLLLIYSSMRSLVICKYRDSNKFGNHWKICILSARMVQSVELVWTVLQHISFFPFYPLHPPANIVIIKGQNGTGHSQHIVYTHVLY